MDFKKLLPHFIAVGILLAVAAFFFAPNAFSGKVLPQPDNDKARAMQTEVQAYMKKDGKAPLWTNSGFSGMPAYQIYSPVEGNLTQSLSKAIFLFGDYTSVWTQVFAAMFCMYLFLSVLKIDWRVAVFGALAYGISTYNIDLIEAGHSTKMAALALTPAMLAGVVMAFNGRWLLGTGVLALFTAMQVFVNHVQITYYTLMIIGIYYLVQLIEAIRSKNYLIWGRGLAVSGLAIAIGFACNTSRLWPTYEYSKETIRGKSELTQRAGKGDGLDKDYLFGWSYGVGESLTLLVPHAFGGGANETIQEGEFYDKLAKGRSAAEKRQLGSQIASAYYWGDQPFVGTAIYFGAVVMFLFVFGAWLAPGSVKWWLLAAGLFSLSLAWGKNFFLNDIFYDILPMFNKFRAVSMALGLTLLCMAGLAAMGLQKLFDASISREKKTQALYAALGVTGLLCLAAGFMGAGVGPQDARLAEQLQMQNLSDILIRDRESMARSDAFRSLGFILAAAALVWLYLRGTLRAGVAVWAIAAISLADTWMVCSRTISADEYEAKRSVIAPPKEEAFDTQIKKDPDIHFRVFDMARGGATTNYEPSFFHKNMSGYHAAKLQRYQEVIDTFFTGNVGQNLHVVGMFNGKYIITTKGEVVANPEALGHAWFVKHYQIVPNADVEFNALHNLNPRDTAVVQQDFAGPLQGLAIQPDSSATIDLVSYHPDLMVYEYSAKTEQLAVFPEVYYPPSKGWKCYLNGQPAPDFTKVDYLLRGMRLPAGDKMKLEMRFEPRSYYLGEKISMAASILALLFFFGGLFWWFRKNPLVSNVNLADMPSGEKPATAKESDKNAPKKGKK
ncbi:MAG: hypothetical protein IT259_05275 [Saprospiraceae bacterium]|nr:hypothetical protein [Saprospiraceae bacterium]